MGYPASTPLPPGAIAPAPEPAAPAEDPAAASSPPPESAAAEPAPEPEPYEPGTVYLYPHLSHFPTPKEREQVVLVTEVSDQGRARGAVLGYADELPEFAPGQLVKLGE